MSGPVLNGGPVVVVGGGVVGLSIAYHLAARGYRDVTVAERGAIAGGATARATGGVRQQFSTAINIELSHRAVAYFERFEERVGEPILFRQHGYLFLLDREEQWETFRVNAAKQRAAGVPVELLAPDEIAAVMPHARVADLVGASYCPTDGSASPSDVAHAFARRARAFGARVLEDTDVVAVARNGRGGVAGVETSRGPLPAELVVNAAGPWAADVGRLVDEEIPVVPYRRQAFGIKPLDWLTPDLPLTIDFGSGAYLHPEASGGVIGGTDRRVAPGVDTAVDWSLTDRLVEALVHRIPALAEAEIRGGWAGLREITPDDHAILGPVPAVPGFWVAAGFSGHGFMHAPVVGEVLSRWLVDGSPGLDVGALRYERFAEGTVVREAAVF